ncbi:MAG: endonuclease/exonuclease/phosphatase family protein [Pseudomonadota bacterium]
MTKFTIASFNVKNLIGPDQEYYTFESYTPEEYAWKEDWMADQLLTMNADVVCFQEIFERSPLWQIVEETNRRGAELNADVIPDKSKRYHRKAIFQKLRYDMYGQDSLFFAPNANDKGLPGQRRPGLAILSRTGFVDEPKITQVLDEPLTISFRDLDGANAGSYTITRISRPIIRARIPIGDHIVSVFNCHLKSKLGEFSRQPGADFSREANLLDYDPYGRALGSIRSTMRRMAEAAVMRKLILDELAAGYPVMSLGDYNDGEHSTSSAVIAGERPFRNYAWMRRHDATNRSDRYSDAEDAQIRQSIEAVQMVSAEKLFVRRSLRDTVYTSAFGGVHESIDQILMSRHFHPETTDALGEMEYFSILNDHITDGSHPEAPYNKLASDHGQIIAHMKLYD